MTAELIEWINGSGEETVQIHHTIGLRGFHGPPPQRTTESTYSGYPGAVLDQPPEDLPRDLFVPALIHATTRLGRQKEIRKIAAAVRWAPGSRLRFTDSDGVAKEAREVRIEGGLDIEDRAPTWVAPVLHFRALDPYWYDVDQTEVQVALALESSFTATGATASDDPNVGSDDPIPSDGLSGGGTSVSGSLQFAIPNDSDVTVEPIWEVTGPFSLMEATNIRTGEVWTYTGDVAAGQSLLIDTRLRAAAPVLLDGSDSFQPLTRHQLWHLQPGNNQINVRVIATGPETSVGVAWTGRRRTL